MELTTEPVIAVLGYPIAGNPAQFALERAFVALQLDWRVLSFDVDPMNLPVALAGLDVIGVEGVLLDASLDEAAQHWAISLHQVTDDAPTLPKEANDAATSETSVAPHPQRFDFLHRDHSVSHASPKAAAAENTPWKLGDSTRQFLVETTREHFSALGRSIESWAWLGNVSSDLSLAKSLVDFLPVTPFDSEQASSLDLIVISQMTDRSQPVNDFDNSGAKFDSWPPTTTSTLVIDLAGASDSQRLIKLGYRVIVADELQAGRLGACLRAWTGKKPPPDVLRDAIEEYLAI